MEELTNLQIGLLAVVPYLVATIGMILWSRHSERTGERRMHSAWPLLLAAIANIVGPPIHFYRQPENAPLPPEKAMLFQMLWRKKYRQGCYDPDGIVLFIGEQGEAIPSRRTQTPKDTHRLSMNVLGNKFFFISELRRNRA